MRRDALRLAGDGLADRGLRRGEPRDRHAIGRARHVIEADLVAEGDGSRIPAMFAADADLEIWPRLAAARNTDLHQLADTVALDRNEWIHLQNSLGRGSAEETGGV